MPLIKTNNTAFFAEARRIPPQYQEIRHNIENSCCRYFASSLDAPQSGGPSPPVRILWSVGYPQSSIDRELLLSELLRRKGQPPPNAS